MTDTATARTAEQRHQDTLAAIGRLVDTPTARQEPTLDPMPRRDVELPQTQREADLMSCLTVAATALDAAQARIAELEAQVAAYEADGRAEIAQNETIRLAALEDRT